MLSRIEVNGLSGFPDFDIRIEDNKLILIGENGTGKSTVISLIYRILTRNFVALLDYNFKSIAITYKGKKVVVDREMLVGRIKGSSRTELRHHVVSSVKDVYRKLSLSGIGVTEAINNWGPEIYEKIDPDQKSPPHLVKRRLQQLRDILSDGMVDLFDDSDFSILNEIRVLYLPTYRRIEKDLESLMADTSYRLERVRAGSVVRDRMRDDPHLELIQFGMEDVEALLKSTLRRLDMNFRSSLSELINEYVRFLFSKDRKIEKHDFRDLDNSRISSALERVDPSMISSEILSDIDGFYKGFVSTDDVGDVFSAIQSDFVYRLCELDKEQEERESMLRSFCRICNHYLNNKSFSFDKRNYSMRLSRGIDETAVQLKDLSSGEKQIVSLFAHILLSDGDPFFVIIDEPELSLSIPWQENFLPDILSSGRCSGLIAVTHSPFVYKNGLTDHVRSIEEFFHEK